MNSDSVFMIGSTHEVCQDYAVSGKSADRHFAILSDGCSAAEDSDIGSRILTKVAEDLLLKTVADTENCDTFSKEFKDVAKVAASNSETITRSLKISKYSIDATLMYIVAENGNVLATMCGDGVIVFGNADKTYSIVEVDYQEGYPRYPSYDNSGERKQLFDDETGNICRIRHIHVDADFEIITDVTEIPKDNTCFSACRSSNAETDMPIKFAAILSDGIHTFHKKVNNGTSIYNSPIPFLSVLKELMTFKGFVGRFVHRRVNKFVSECNDPKNQKYGWKHADDLSVAVVYAGE